MKMSKKLCVALVIVAMLAPAVGAQSLKGMTLNGATGLIALPNARIGWEKSANLGLDIGYHTAGFNSHIPKVALSLFKWVEVSVGPDIQNGTNETDLHITYKVQFPTGKTDVAVGGNVQLIDMGRTQIFSQLYIVATYGASFFDMPADTTILLGYTFGSGSNIDIGIGFDLLFFPNVFGRYVHWLIDYSNFAYSVDPRGVSAARGVVNTGLRLDLGALPAFKRYKFVIDANLADALDSNRSFNLGIVFGVPLM